MFNYLSSTIKLRLLMNFISKATSSMLLPFVTILYAKEFGIVIAGTLISITSFFQIGFSIYGGQLTEKFGRIPLMKWGECIKLFCFLVLLFYSNTWIVFFVITIISAAQGFINPAIDSMLIDESNDEIKAKVLSLNNWIYNTSYLIGAMIGGWLFQKNFVVIVILLILSSLFVLWNIFANMNETHIVLQSKKLKYGFFSSYSEVITNKKFVLFSIGMMFFLFLQRTLTNYIAVSFKSTLIPFTQIMLNQEQLLSVVLTINTILVIAFLPIVTFKFNILKTRFFLILSMILIPIGFFVLSYSNTFSHIIIGTILFTAGELVFTPSMQAVFISTIDEDNKGPYNAILSTFQSISKILSSIFLSVSVIFTQFGNASLLFIVGFLGILLILLVSDKPNKLIT